MPPTDRGRSPFRPHIVQCARQLSLPANLLLMIGAVVCTAESIIFLPMLPPPPILVCCLLGFSGVLNFQVFREDNDTDLGEMTESDENREVQSEHQNSILELLNSRQPVRWNAAPSFINTAALGETACAEELQNRHARESGP